MHERPEVAEPIAAVLAERRVALLAAKEGLTAEARARRLDQTRVDLLAKMRAFFAVES